VGRVDLAGVAPRDILTRDTLSQRPNFRDDAIGRHIVNLMILKQLPP